MTLACADPGAEWVALIEPPTLNDAYLVPLLECIVKLNDIYLQENTAPPLYQAGVRYLAEPEGQEHWRTIPIVQRLGYADCKSLAAWRVAELRRSGIRAKCRFSRKQTPLGRLWHIFVVLPTGREEDPSRILGMGRPW